MQVYYDKQFDQMQKNQTLELNKDFSQQKKISEELLNENINFWKQRFQEERNDNLCLKETARQLENKNQELQQICCPKKIQDQIVQPPSFQSIKQINFQKFPNNRQLKEQITLQPMICTKQKNSFNLDLNKKERQKSLKNSELSFQSKRNEFIESFQQKQNLILLIEEQNCSEQTRIYCSTNSIQIKQTLFSLFKRQESLQGNVNTKFQYYQQEIYKIENLLLIAHRYCMDFDTSRNLSDLQIVAANIIDARNLLTNLKQLAVINQTQVLDEIYELIKTKIIEEVEIEFRKSISNQQQSEQQLREIILNLQQQLSNQTQLFHECQKQKEIDKQNLQTMAEEYQQHLNSFTLIQNQSNNDELLKELQQKHKIIVDLENQLAELQDKFLNELDSKNQKTSNINEFLKTNFLQNLLFLSKLGSILPPNSCFNKLQELIYQIKSNYFDWPIINQITINSQQYIIDELVRKYRENQKMIFEERQQYQRRESVQNRSRNQSREQFIGDSPGFEKQTFSQQNQNISQQNQNFNGQKQNFMQQSQNLGQQSKNFSQQTQNFSQQKNFIQQKQNFLQQNQNLNEQKQNFSQQKQSHLQSQSKQQETQIQRQLEEPKQLSSKIQTNSQYTQEQSAQHNFKSFGNEKINKQCSFQNDSPVQQDKNSENQASINFSQKNLSSNQSQEIFDSQKLQFQQNSQYFEENIAQPFEEPKTDKKQQISLFSGSQTINKNCLTPVKHRNSSSVVEQNNEKIAAINYKGILSILVQKHKNFKYFIEKIIKGLNINKAFASQAPNCFCSVNLGNFVKKTNVIESFDPDVFISKLYLFFLFLVKLRIKLRDKYLTK